jgi:NAD(P)H-quinone oxidoreductase subunit L
MESIFNNSIFVLVAYVGVISIYLLIIPLILFYWMNNRWNIMGKLERFGIYGLVFLFFPGLILFSPFLNLRLKGESKG